MGGAGAPACVVGVCTCVLIPVSSSGASQKAAAQVVAHSALAGVTGEGGVDGGGGRQRH